MKMYGQIVQTVMGMAGSLGFAVLYNIRGKKLFLIAAGGGIGWAVYLLCRGAGLDLFWGLFWGTFSIALFSAIAARIVKVPVIVLLTPMTIPMIPGSDLYYTMEHLVNREFSEFGMSVNKVLSEAFAMALGIAVSSYLVRLVTRQRG